MKHNEPMTSPVKTLIVVACSLALRSSAETSELWGTNGELWNPGGRLPDFSYAGYHCGEAAIPHVATGINVTIDMTRVPPIAIRSPLGRSVCVAAVNTLPRIT